MLLRVSLLSSSVTLTCFVSLPPQIVASLVEQEQLHFLVLSVKPRGCPAELQNEVYVGWDGGATDASDRIGFHPMFAHSLDLKEGQELNIEAVSLPSTAISPSATVNAGTPQDFALIIATSDFVENSLLNQIRVLFPGLVFPVQLPGRAVVHLVVSHIFTVCDELPSFVILDARSEVAVLPPKSDPDRSEMHEPSVTSISQKFRVLPMPVSKLSMFPTHIVCRTFSETFKDHAVRVSRIEKHPSVFRSCPAFLVCREDVDLPKDHIYVPPHVWRELCLSEFCPVEVQSLAEGELARTPDSVYFLSPKISISDGSRFHCLDVETLSRTLVTLLGPPTVIYPGMMMGPWVVGSSFSEADINNVRLASEREFSAPVADQWDLNESPLSSLQHFLKPSEDVNKENGTVSKLEQYSCPPVWFISGSEKIEPRESASLPWHRFHQYLDKLSHCVPSSFAGSRSGLSTVRGRGIRGNVKSISDHVRNTCRIVLSSSTVVGSHASSLQNTIRHPCAVLIRGGFGSGRTSLACAVAQELRVTSFMRTVWISWRSHKDDTLPVSLARLQVAFQAAANSAPALVVLDDIDAVAGSARASTAVDEHGDSDLSSRSKVVKAHEFSCAVRNAIALHGKVGSVAVVMTCSADIDLDDELRVPGLITLLVDIQAPDEMDRALVFSEMILRRLGSDVIRLHRSDPLRKAVCQTASICEGFEARDLEAVMERALGESKNGEISPKNILEAARASVPASRIGLHFESGSDGSPESWDLVGGQAEAKRALRDALELPSKFSSVFDQAPIRLQTGIMLYGPPGCGKTLLAKVATRACGMRSISVSGPEILSKYIGESEAGVRRLFERASKITPCVIIFDEFDAIAPRRGGETTGVADRVVNTLLTMLDGVERLAKGIFVIATTSRPELIDPALLRPGRIDRWVLVDFPSADERFQILQCLCRTSKSPSADFLRCLRHVAETTEGMTGADLRGIVTTARVQYERSVSWSRDGDFVEPALLIDALLTARPSVSKSARARYISVHERFVRSTSLSTVDRPSSGTDPNFEGKRLLRVALQ